MFTEYIPPFPLFALSQQDGKPLPLSLGNDTCLLLFTDPTEALDYSSQQKFGSTQTVRLDRAQAIRELLQNPDIGYTMVNIDPHRDPSVAAPLLFGRDTFLNMIYRLA